MKGREMSKARFFCECFFEKCMEWVDFLRYGLIKRDTWISNLVEHYYIYKEYMGKEFVKEFLDEREHILSNNRYKMEIKILTEKGEEDTVGMVKLYSNNKFIHQATLKVKGDDRSNNRLIFWSFDNNSNH